MSNLSGHTMGKGRRQLWRAVAILCQGMTAISGTSLAAAILVVCLDVVMRTCGHPLKGVYDLVRIAGAIMAACALPYTTAVKGHVAVEYFFLKLNRSGRFWVDATMRLVMIAALLCAAWACVGYGQSFLRGNQVSDTIELPIFWVPWLMAVAFTVSALVVLFHLLHPGEELMRE